MGICKTWATVYGLRDVGLRTLQFFVNCRRAADAHGDPPVRVYRKPALVSAVMGLVCMSACSSYGDLLAW